MKHTSSILALWLILSCIVCVGTVSIATASEITGTLSSDGSNNTEPTAVRETNQNSGTLQGTVIGGTSAEQGQTTTKEALMWSALAVLMMTTSYLWWTRNA